MDRDLRWRAAATCVISCARNSWKETKDLNCPGCLLLSWMTLYMSLLSLKCPFRPVLCPLCPLQKRLKFVQTVYVTKFIDNFEGFRALRAARAYFCPVFSPGRTWNLSCKSSAWLNRKQVAIKFNHPVIITFFLKCYVLKKNLSIYNILKQKLIYKTLNIQRGGRTNFREKFPFRIYIFI